MSALLDAQTHYASLVQTQTAQTRLPLAASGTVRNHADVEKVAGDFESFFLAQMFQHMTSGLRVDSTFGGGHAEEMLRSLLTDAYGKLAVKAGRGVGLADSLVREMIKLQEVQPNGVAEPL